MEKHSVAFYYLLIILEGWKVRNRGVRRFVEDLPRSDQIWTALINMVATSGESELRSLNVKSKME